MANASRDNNNIPTMIGVLNTDGTTPTKVQATASANTIKVSDGSTGSDFGADHAARDANNVPVLMAVSSTDGSTPVPLYVDNDGNLLVKST